MARFWVGSRGWVEGPGPKGLHAHGRSWSETGGKAPRAGALPATLCKTDPEGQGAIKARPEFGENVRDLT